MSLNTNSLTDGHQKPRFILRLNFILQNSLPLLSILSLYNSLFLQLKYLMGQQVVINLRHGHAGEFAFGALFVNRKDNLWKVRDFG